MFDIRESPINKIFEGKSFSKKFCSRNFSYQPRVKVVTLNVNNQLLISVNLIFHKQKNVHENYF